MFDLFSHLQGGRNVVGFTICLSIIMPNCSAVVGINMMQEEVKGIIFILFSSYNFVFYFTLWNIS